MLSSRNGFAVLGWVLLSGCLWSDWNGWEEKFDDFDRDGFPGPGAGGTDCDDKDPEINPDATEICDDADNDGDGYGEEFVALQTCDEPQGYALATGDCDDTEPTVFPGATEICDGLRNACQELPDDEIDNDSDGVVECAGGWGDVAGGDCDDTDDSVFPGAEALCDGIVNDCNTKALPDNERDDDGDGFVECDGDCDDSEDTVYPGATESCDGQLNDCDAGDLAADEIDDDSDGFVDCTVDEHG